MNSYGILAASALLFLASAQAIAETGTVEQTVQVDDIDLDQDIEDAVIDADDADDVGYDAIGAAEEADIVPEIEDTPVEAAGEAPRPPAAVAPPRRPAVAPTRMTLRSIDFTASEYLDAADLDLLRPAFLGRQVDLVGLGGLIEAVDALYQDRGILLARAVVGSVSPASGHVVVELQEARLGSVDAEAAEGDHQLIDADYIAWRVGMGEGDLADNRLIDERVARLALTDGLQISPQIAPGAVPGIVHLGLVVVEQPQAGGYVAVDHLGKKATGETRFSTGFFVRSLTGWNDPFNVSATVTRGSLSGAASYARVVHPLGTRISVAVDASRSRTLATPTVTNQAFGGELGLSHPFVMRQNYRLQGSASVLGFRERGSITGVPLVSQDGAGGRVGLSQFANGAGWFVSSSQTLTGISWRDRIVGGPSLSHFALSGNLAFAVQLGANHLIALQAAGQLAFNDRAPSRYRFTVAGPAGVRGYDADLSSGDSGFYARLQVERSTPLPLGIENFSLRPFAFADIGRAWDFNAGTHVAQDVLAGAGAGVSFVLSNRVSGDVYVAKPLKDANGFVSRRQYEVRGGVTVSF